MHLKKDSQEIVTRLSCSLCLHHRGISYTELLFWEGLGWGTILLHRSSYNNARTNTKFQPSLSKNRKQFFWLLPGVSHETRDYRGYALNPTHPRWAASGVSVARKATCKIDQDQKTNMDPALQPNPSSVQPLTWERYNLLSESETV